MPTYRAYKRDSGFYIRSNINSSFITLQVSLAAEKFLRGLSYGDEDSLSWHLIIPLMQQGHITTGEAGPSEQEVEADVDTSQSAKLNPDERTALQEFLSTPNSDPSPSEKAVTAIQRLDPTLSTSDIQECWEAAHNTEAFTASVTTMADQHPIQVKGFGVNQGHPAYLFSTRGIRWKAFESFRDSESDNEWIIYTRPSQTGDSQLLRLQQGRLTRWKVYSDTSSGAQRADLAALLPDILYLLDRYPSYTPVPGDWEINKLPQLRMR